MRTIDELLTPAKVISGKQSYICPNCSNGAGDSHTGITEDPNRPGHYHCFVCGFDGDIFDIMDIVDGRPAGESYKAVRAFDLSALEIGKSTEPKVPLAYRKGAFYEYLSAAARVIESSERAKEYLHKRGFSDADIKNFGFGYDAARDTITIPYPGTERGYYISRSIDGKQYLKPPTSTAGSEPIFNADALGSGTSVYITEGQFDALSIIAAGGNAAALGGAGERKLIEYQGCFAETVCIVADNDAAGEAIAQKIKDVLKNKGVNACIVHPPKEFKDANEFLVSDRDLLSRLIKNDSWAKYEYSMQESARSCISDFWNSAQTRTTAIKTGFPKFDEAIGGGLYEGLYIMGAVSSLGKTTFCLQLADQIARTHDVLIFSLEMARYELMAKSLSRLSFEMCNGYSNNAKTSRALTDPEQIARFSLPERELMNRITAEYCKIASRIWISEGLGTIGTAQINEAIERHIQITGTPPFVLIDYLQIIASPDVRMSDKQATDRNVFELKRISREHKCPILAISSFNRDNYTAPLSMAAFKESGAIEYSSDVLFGLQPQGMNTRTTDSAKSENALTLDSCKRADVRKLELKVLKNRNGRTGSIVNYQYKPMFNYFKED